MPHYRTMMDRDSLGAWDLPTDKTATIERVEAAQLPGAGKIKASRKPIIHFKGTPKVLIVNSTIGKTIAGMYGNDTDGWVGKRITLYGTTCRGADGSTVECIRVRPKIPTAPGAPIPSQPVDEEMRERQRRAAGGDPTTGPNNPHAGPPSAMSDAPREREPGEEG